MRCVYHTAYDEVIEVGRVELDLLSDGGLGLFDKTAGAVAVVAVYQIWLISYAAVSDGVCHNSHLEESYRSPGYRYLPE